MEARVRTWSTTLLAGGLLISGSVAVTHLDQGIHAVYQAGTLLIGGFMVLAGVLIRRTAPSLGTALLIVGAVAGLAVRVETVVLPILVVLTVVLTLRDQTRVTV